MGERREIGNRKVSERGREREREREERRERGSRIVREKDNTHT